jgi:Lrp/AsnC family transcriptional regulator, leucine-responsive regulatory protein
MMQVGRVWRKALSGCDLARPPLATWEDPLVEDDVDRRILALLGTDGRMSYADLARDTGLSTSAVHQRVRRLEERGVITGYAAVINPRAVGLPLTALIDLTPLDPSAPDDIPQRVEGFAEIESCWSVAGSASYVVKVRVAEPTDLEDLLARIRAAAGVSTRTTIVLSTPFEGRPPALA